MKNDLFGYGPELPPVSRMNDPDTSKMAEEFINKIGSRRTHILLFLELLDQYERDYAAGLESVDLTATEMGRLLYQSGALKSGRVAWTAPHKRLADLANMGMAVVTGTLPNPDTGRPQHTWRITDKGREAYSRYLNNRERADDGTKGG